MGQPGTSTLENPRMVSRRSKIVNVATVPHRSPFRYPGGKTWLVPYIRQWLRSIKPAPTELAEPSWACQQYSRISWIGSHWWNWTETSIPGTFHHAFQKPNLLECDGAGVHKYLSANPSVDQIAFIKTIRTHSTRPAGLIQHPNHSPIPKRYWSLRGLICITFLRIRGMQAACFHAKVARIASPYPPYPRSALLPRLRPCARRPAR